MKHPSPHLGGSQSKIDIITILITTSQKNCDNAQLNIHIDITLLVEQSQHHKIPKHNKTDPIHVVSPGGHTSPPGSS